MQIRSVTIYKTPLDNSYSNVVDFINFEGNKKYELSRILNESYSHKSFSVLDRSIKRVGNTTLIVLPIDYDEGRNYNYMIIEDDSQTLYFYFITNITSENDNHLNPSSSFTLEWDVWNNNIDEFKHINNNIERKHYDRFSPIYGSYDEVIGLSPIYRNNSINLTLNTYYRNVNYGSRYIPAFFVIYFKDMLTLPAPNVIRDIPNGLTFGLPASIVGVDGLDDAVVTEQVTICDCVNNKYNRKVIYQFAGIFDTEEEKFIEGFIEGATLEFIRNNDTYRYNPVYSGLTYGLVSTPRLVIDNEKTPYIDTISLSFNSPFRYTFDEYTKTMSFTDNPVVVDIANNSIYSVGEYIPYIICGDLYFPNADVKSIRYYADNFRSSYNIERDRIIGYSDILMDNQTFLNVDIDLIDPISYTPPFTSLILAYNSKYENLFTPWYNDNITLKIIKETYQPQLEVYYGTNKTVTPDRLFIENSGFFSFGVDSLANYMARSGKLANVRIAENMYKLGSGIVQMVAGAKTGSTSTLQGGINKTENSAFGLLKENAQLMDAYRTPDEWASNSGECDIIYQDRVRLIVEEVDRNNFTYREYMKAVYNEGYEFVSVDSPFRNCRISFDYVKTSNCDLSALKINQNDIKTLERVFNNGVTKWHILSSPQGETLFSKDMIKDSLSIRNLESKTIFDQDINRWLNG